MSSQGLCITNITNYLPDIMSLLQYHHGISCRDHELLVSVGVKVVQVVDWSRATKYYRVDLFSEVHLQKWNMSVDFKSVEKDLIPLFLYWLSHKLYMTTVRLHSSGLETH